MQNNHCVQIPIRTGRFFIVLSSVLGFSLSIIAQMGRGAVHTSTWEGPGITKGRLEHCQNAELGGSTVTASVCAQRCTIVPIGGRDSAGPGVATFRRSESLPLIETVSL